MSCLEENRVNNDFGRQSSMVKPRPVDVDGWERGKAESGWIVLAGCAPRTPSRTDHASGCGKGQWKEKTLATSLESWVSGH